VVGTVSVTREELIELIKKYGDARAWQNFQETGGSAREEGIARQASEYVLKDIHEAIDDYRGPGE
jgi:hypothetical protein